MSSARNDLCFSHFAFVLCEPDEIDGKDDDEIKASCPSNWWLRGNQASVIIASDGDRGLLALQVHCNSKEIAAECTSQPPGATRVAQRQLKESETRMVRANEKADKESRGHFFCKEKRVRLQVVNVAILEKQNNMISKQRALLDANKEVFIRKYDQKTYDNKVVALLAQLPNPSAGLVDDAPKSDAADGDEDLVDRE